MRVWIENPFDNLPIEGFRPQRFWLMADAFAASKHDVTLWTSDFNHTTKRKRVKGEWSRAKGQGAGEKTLNPQLSTFNCIQIPSIPYSKNVSVRRMFSHWRYAVTWEKMARKFAAENGKPDVIIVSTPPLSTGAVARRLAKEYGARLIFDVMDAWPETFERVAPRWALAPLRRIAKGNYLAADHITTVADRYIDLVRSYGYNGPATRFYHGITIGDTAADSPLCRAACSADTIHLAYIGNLGRTYDLETVVKALETLPTATLEIAGQGEQEAMLRRRAAENPRIKFLGYLGEDDMNALLKRCDIGIVPMAPESCVGVPYKFADYTRAGLAIVSSLGGESGDLLKRYGAGLSYRAGDAADLATAISTIAASPEKYRRAALELAKTEFSASAIYAAYVKTIEALRGVN